MSLSSLPLSYCTNVHPGRTLDAVLEGLTTYTAAVQQEFGSPLAAGLWLAQPVIAELSADVRHVERLAAAINNHQLTCYTLNAFPYGDFHSERVKEQVYLPDWTRTERRLYTSACAAVLTALMPEGTEGSISTVPLGFKQLPHEDGFLDQCIDNLIGLAHDLDELHDQTGRVVRLAIEPEPLCILETTAETIAFFERLRAQADERQAREVVQRHLGVCFDVCHQSVEFEDVADSIAQLRATDIRINKVHITCALQLDRPAENREGRETLAEYVEPRYLHQTFARQHTGRLLATVDLSRPLALEPPDDYLQAETWRVHFHVPVNVEAIGPLKTTRPDLQRALAAVADLDYAPHLEVETYTWGVLPGEDKPSLVEGLTAELQATHTLLASL